MKRLFYIGLLFCAMGCARHEDAPPPYYPHIAGQWIGNGVDNATGYFNFSVVLAQSGNTASGSYTTSSSYVSTHGTIYLVFGPENGNNLQQLAMTDSTGPVHSLAEPTFITDTAVNFCYTGGGCANLHKVAGTN